MYNEFSTAIHISSTRFPQVINSDPLDPSPRLCYPPSALGLLVYVVFYKKRTPYYCCLIAKRLKIKSSKACGNVDKSPPATRDTTAPANGARASRRTHGRERRLAAHRVNTATDGQGGIFEWQSSAQDPSPAP